MAQRVLSRSGLKRLPKPRPLIDGLMFTGSVVGLFASAGVGKSALALDWCATLSVGGEWKGRRCRRSKVLYCAGEGREGLDQRLSAWEAHSDRLIDDDWFAVYPAAIDLSNAKEIAEMALLIEQGGFQIVVIDTLARSMPGLDENSSRDMGAAVDSLERLLHATPGQSGMVLVLHHVGKDKRTVRGSTALPGALNTTFELTGTPTSLRLRNTKQRDGPDGLSIDLRLVEVGDSIVIDAPGSRVRGHFEGRSDERLLSVIVSTFGGGPVPRAELRNAAQLPSASFHRAISRLLKDGKVSNIGDEDNPKYLAGDF